MTQPRHPLILIKYISLLSILFFQPTFWSCRKDTAAGPLLIFDSIPVARTVDPLLREASGIADSKTGKGLWVQEDSGNPTQLYLLGYDGKLARKVYLSGVTNRDWEDLALVDNQLYLADIGDNNKVYADYTIYRFDEPAPGTDTVANIQAIRFRYPDGAHDAEAILVDPSTKDLYIITKGDKPSRIYKVAYPYSTTTVQTATAAGSLGYSGVVGAALSANGRELLVKTYFQLYYYQRPAGATLEQVLQKGGVRLPYQPEPQGEAVTFAADNGGFYTLSEKGFFNRVDLFFYQRK